MASKEQRDLMKDFYDHTGFEFMEIDDQKRLGWTDRLRVEIMTYYYKHRGSVPCFAAAI